MSVGDPASEPEVGELLALAETRIREHGGGRLTMQCDTLGQRGPQWIVTLRFGLAPRTKERHAYADTLFTALVAVLVDEGWLHIEVL